MGPKTKTNTYEFTEFSLVLTLSLFRKRSFSLSFCSLLIAKQVLLLRKQASSPVLLQVAV